MAKKREKNKVNPKRMEGKFKKKEFNEPENENGRGRNDKDEIVFLKTNTADNYL